MKDRFAITIHLTNAEKETIIKAAEVQGLTLKSFIELTTPYLAKRMLQDLKEQLCEK